MLDIFDQLKAQLKKLFSKPNAEKQSQSVSNKPAHDLGHASKCIWELDKEA